MIRIMTDSAADLLPSELALPGVSIAPMSILFDDGTSVEDGVGITKDEFFAKMATGHKLPRTSQPSPEHFIRFLEECKAAGDEAIIITISSKLSGTYQCACMAAADCGGDNVYVVDSCTATQGEAFLLREAVRLRDEGKSAPEIVAALENLKNRIVILAVVDSLKHLHKGGRLPAVVAVAGGALGIKPVITLRDGEVKMADKARGRPGALLALFKQVDKVGGVDTRYGYSLVYSDDRTVAVPLHRYTHQNLHLSGARVAQIGATIGTHIGPGAAGIIFVAKRPDNEE